MRKVLMVPIEDEDPNDKTLKVPKYQTITVKYKRFLLAYEKDTEGMGVLTEFQVMSYPDILYFTELEIRGLKEAPETIWVKFGLYSSQFPSPKGMVTSNHKYKILEWTDEDPTQQKE